MAKIVWLDDTAPMLEVVAARLTHLGHEVTTTTDEAEAMATLERDGADLFVQDLVRPGVGGIEFLRAMRERPGLATIPVVICSASAAPSGQMELPDPRGGPAMDVQGWLEKPMTPDTLVAAINAALQGQRLTG